MRRKTFAVQLAIVSAFISFAVFSHGGRTNAQGCHTESKTGDYHCHTPKAPSQNSNRINYCHIINGERRCGYAESSCKSLAQKHGGYCEIQS